MPVARATVPVPAPPNGASPGGASRHAYVLGTPRAGLGLGALALALGAGRLAAQVTGAAPLGTFAYVDGYGGWHHRTFLPGGLVYAGLPAGGPEVFGAAQARAGDPRKLGRYTLRGGTMVTAWGGGEKPETTTFAVKGRDVVLGGRPHYALYKYPAGHRLDGRFSTTSYNRLGVAGGGTMTWGGTGTVVFRPDGTFDYGRSGMASTTAGGGAAASGEARSSGRYAVAGNTVTFTFADGTRQHALVHPWKGEERLASPESLNLNGNTYLLRK